MTALDLTGRDQWIDFRGVPVAGWDAFYAAAKKKGIVGAIRYISSGSDGKQIHNAERLAAEKHGMKLLLVDELNTGDAWDSSNDQAAGFIRGKSALIDAAGEGFGPTTGISAAADAHAPSPRHIGDAVEYGRGFARAVGKAQAGFYGFMEVLRAVKAANIVSWYWLAGSKPSAEDAKWLAFWQDNTGFIYIAGVQCDRNWRLNGPIPTTTIKEDDMDQTEPLKDSGPGRANHIWLNTNMLLNNRSFGLAAIGAQLKALTAAVAADKDISSDELELMLTAAVAKALPLNDILDAIRESVPDEIADDVVRKVGEKLSIPSA